MKKKKFRVGNIVQVVNPDKEYPNRMNVINKVARIIRIYKNQFNPYLLEFIGEEPIGVSNGSYGVRYNENEIKKLKKIEAFMELI
jgi:hypothetical protein